MDSKSITAGGHLRVRPFNTKETYPEQNLDNDLCQAVVAPDRLPAWSDRPGPRHFRECLHRRCRWPGRAAMTNIEMLLKEAGGELQDICKITIYLIDPRYREAVYLVVGRRLKGVLPVSTGIVVSALARPEWLVEIDATAVIPD